MKQLITILTLAVLLTAALAETKAQETKQLSELELNNLITAIQSDNEGLKRSAIYFAGYYQLDETVDALIDELEKTDNPQTKVLIALSLYQIGDAAVLDKLAELAMDEYEAARVRHMASAIYTEWTNNLHKGFAIVD